MLFADACYGSYNNLRGVTEEDIGIYLDNSNIKAIAKARYHIGMANTPRIGTKAAEALVSFAELIFRAEWCESGLLEVDLMRASELRPPRQRDVLEMI